MGKKVVQIDFVPDGQPPQRADDDIIWSVIGALVLILAIVIFVKLLPFLLVVLALAAILAAISTWRSAHRRGLWRRLGWPTPRVGVKTYLSFLAAWFVGLLVLVPLILLGAVAAVVVLAVIGVILAVALVVSLLRGQ